MRLCRFGDDKLGLVDGEFVLDVTQALDVLPACRWPFPAGDLFIRHLEQIRARIGAIRSTAVRFALADVCLHAPVANPTKIVGAPVNYHKHHAEAVANPAVFSAEHTRRIHEVGLFLKATSSLAGPAEGVRLREPKRRTDHEIELAVVIGRTADRISREQALAYVAGYAIGLDMTIRGSEERSMRKSADSYSVLGPWLVTADEILDPAALDIELYVNDEPRQKANTRDLIVGIAALIEWASAFYTLHPGDIIMTGTPDGVGPVKPGDVMVACINGVGRMTVPVSAA